MTRPNRNLSRVTRLPRGPLPAVALTLAFMLTTALAPRPAAAAQPPATQEKPASPASPTRPALAEHFAQLAQLTVSQRPITPETLRQSIALLKAAHKLDPGEARFVRLLAEAALQAGDADTAYDAFKTLHDIDPRDRVAQVRLIDLHTARLQTADKRLEYLKGVSAHEKLPTEVRAHAAFVACQLYFERAERTEAVNALEEALRLFPLSPEALKLKYELFGETGPPRQRVALLLTMLRSNPAQPGVMAKLAGELARVGLHEQSMNWYGSAQSLSNRVGRDLPVEDLDNWAAQLLTVGNAPAAQQLAAQLLEADPRDVDAAFLTLLIQRRGGDAEKLTAAADVAERALIGRAIAVRQMVEGETPTTQPAAADAQVDVPGDIKRLLEVNDPRLTAAYASTLADLAWLRVYFNEKPADAQQVAAQLRQLMPPDSVTLARLEGWAHLVAGQAPEARVKLSAVADRDPLAQLGMIRLTEQEDPQRATEDARKLMDENPAGLLGAIIHDALRDKKPKLPAGEQPPLSADAQEVKSELDQFPQDWLSFIDKPNTFYLLRCDPLKVSHTYGEPIVARVTIRNIGDHPITVGPDGAIRPDLWFDAQLRGAANAGVQGVAFDRLTQRLVLHPDEELHQNIRVDQSQLLGLLQRNPAEGMPLFFSVFTNPIGIQGGMAPGPGGQRQAFFRVVNRIGIPKKQQDPVATMMRQLQNGPTVAARLRAIDALAWCVHELNQIEDDKAKARAQQVVHAMYKTANDPDPAVRAWAGFVTARLVPPELRKRVMDELLGDPAWEPRLIGLLLVQTLDTPQWKVLAQPLAENDPEPIVRELAGAVVDFADNPASTQPATQPAEGDQMSPVAQP